MQRTDIAFYVIVLDRCRSRCRGRCRRYCRRQWLLFATVPVVYYFAQLLKTTILKTNQNESIAQTVYLI